MKTIYIFIITIVLLIVLLYLCKKEGYGVLDNVIGNKKVRFNEYTLAIHPDMNSTTIERLKDFHNVNPNPDILY